MIISEGFKVNLNKNDFTASILSFQFNSDKIFIPRSINYELNEYNITSIDSFALFENKTINSIQFSDDSEVRLIKQNAFMNSSLKYLNIPSKFEYFEDNWCYLADKLIEIKISTTNNNFCYLDSDNKIIIGKSDLSQNYYDTIVFGCRNIQKVFIPNYIKSISSSAFLRCSFLHYIQISENSELNSIYNCSFAQTRLTSIFIPKHVKVIGASAFFGCIYLETVIFDENSELEFIGQYSFASTKIDEIEIPRSVKIISEYSFYQCKCLEDFSFMKNSQIEIIGEYAFRESAIRYITIPKHVKVINKNTFYYCDNLTVVDFEEGSEITTICKSAFKNSELSSLDIPENLIDLQQGWCKGLEKLESIIVSPKNKRFILFQEEFLIGKSDINKDDYDSLYFACHKNTVINIPSFIKYINSYSISASLSVKTVNLPIKSELLSIDTKVFYYCCVESLYIPSKVIEIKENWCHNTDDLVDISISEKNKNFLLLENQQKVLLCKSNPHQDIFDVILFACRNIRSVFIPRYIKRIGSSAFNECNFLSEIEFENDSEIESFGENAFVGTAIINFLIPQTVVKFEKSCFSCCSYLFSFEALNEIITFTKKIFSDSRELTLLSFPSAIIIKNVGLFVSSLYNTNNIIFFSHANAIIN